MKKNLLIGGALIAMLALTGCSGYETGKVVEDGAWKVIGQKGKYDVLRDTETGCIYLQSQKSTTGLTAYFNEAGEVAGCGDKESTYE